MERKLSATIDKVFGRLTDPKWLQARSLALGELSAKCSTSTKGGLTITMHRRVHRELPALVAKVLNPDSDIELVEQWSETAAGYAGSFELQVSGKPIKVTADFELLAAGKGCVYRIQHKAKVSVPLIGGVIEKFVLGQTEQGCADELDYLVEYLKKNK